jgi:hypothetical protein
MDGPTVNSSRGLKRVRNWCRPYGDSRIGSTHPALPCRAFTCRRYAAESALILLHILSDQVVLTRSLMPTLHADLTRP